MKNTQEIWLFICCFMIILMVGIGGLTRLTGAGLSITEWKPIIGILPPFNKQAWVKEKIKYEATPEYKVYNYDISMKEFQIIYLIEYVHRLVARITGLIFILPLVYFIFKRQIASKVLVKLFVVLLLGVLQAFAGWYMVKSGLETLPHVSHYRLAFHLLLALIIFALLLYQFYDYRIRAPETKHKITNNGIRCISNILILLVLQIIFGAFVAGLNAGLIYNTFPLMDGKIIPDGLFFIQPIWLNFFENKVTIQFLHRILALLILILTIILVVRNPRTKPLLFFFIIQIILGIITLLLQRPIIIAILHQVFSFVLFGANLYFLCYLKKARN
ncbi:heme A synthase [Wolbachia pipientis]|uniref:Heme A synthase n=1 Tax=Wolbachia pipientis TaxID=955 RepID=A0A1E7QKD2_WOLPI|nr:COX15/CtaA family protein [Wolbachia pipientis]OEY86928.1 heme A synthase [Wolbachia pipientis]